ncbi:MAG: hypothetical protein CO118_08645 [Flavobacteriales bacterium CG_4_9_14_3_um_filter_32_8]|nr:MAG: hypothetical protein CO118_08645 [Flavobacteriales bacterium CG_4_9_14_3_um_filter_32_8]
MLVVSANDFAQKHCIGIEYGNGKVHLRDPNYSNLNTIGVKYLNKYTELKSSTYIEEDIEQVTGNDNESSYQHLKTSVGGNLEFGKKLHFIIGVGLNIKLYLNSKGFDEKFKRFSFGNKFNLGMGYYISSKFFAELLYEYHYSFTPVYVQIISGSERKYGDQQNLIKIGISYIIGNKKSNHEKNNL